MIAACEQAESFWLQLGQGAILAITAFVIFGAALVLLIRALDRWCS